MKSVDQMVTAWKNAMASPTTSQRYTDGVNGFQGNPMALAAAAADRYAAGVQRAVSSGKYQDKLNSTPVAAWKNGATQKGAQRLASGASAAVPKMQAFFTKWGPIFANVSSTVSQMPKGGLANAQARAAMAIQMLMQAAGTA